MVVKAAKCLTYHPMLTQQPDLMSRAAQAYNESVLCRDSREPYPSQPQHRIDMEGHHLKVIAQMF